MLYASENARYAGVTKLRSDVTDYDDIYLHECSRAGIQKDL